MSTALDVVFGIFVAMILAVAFLSVRWAIRRDRQSRLTRATSPGAPGTGAPDDVLSNDGRLSGGEPW